MPIVRSETQQQSVITDKELEDLARTMATEMSQEEIRQFCLAFLELYECLAKPVYH